MIDSIFKALYLLGLVAGWWLRKPHFRRLRRQGVSVIPDSRASEYMTPVEKLLGLFFLMGIIVIPIVYVFTPWLDFANYRLPTWVGVVGAAIFATGLWLQWKARVDLGSNLTPTGMTTEGHSLVTDGAYRYIRNPIYAGFWLQAIAQALLLHNWIAGLAGLVLILPIYKYRLRREEQDLLARFGTEYRLYKDRTGRVIPPLVR
jgi:protein-S-isoprenylcysteine O-methyltransferase Ste14